jgi:D-amino-acid oxidase
VLERREVTSLDEAGRDAPFVVNCTGLGARELVPDPDVRPVQGELVVVENPGIDEWFVAADAGASESTYVLPQPYGVVLGGTARDGVWDQTPDPATAAAIVRRCAAVHPELAEAPVLEHRVGLRPSRSVVRIEVERLPGGALCVHNYGHGGAGVTVAWGCAEEAAWWVVAGGEAGAAR